MVTWNFILFLPYFRCQFKISLLHISTSFLIQPQVGIICVALFGKDSGTVKIDGTEKMGHPMLQTILSDAFSPIYRELLLLLKRNSRCQRAHDCPLNLSA